MKVAISFTITLGDLHRRKVALIDIDEFHVGCMREHLFPNYPHHNHMPYEVSWLNKEPGFRSWHGETGKSISMDMVDSKALHTWEIMRAWLVDMDAAGKVKYSVGNYPDLCRKLLKEGHEVWYSGQWQKLENFYSEVC